MALKLRNLVISDRGYLIEEGLNFVTYWFYVSLKDDIVRFIFDSSQLIIYSEDQQRVIFEATSGEMKKLLIDYCSVFITNDPNWMFIGKTRDGDYHGINLYRHDKDAELEIGIAQKSDPTKEFYYDEITYFDPKKFWKVGNFKFGFAVQPNFSTSNKKKLKSF